MQTLKFQMNITASVNGSPGKSLIYRHSLTQRMWTPNHPNRGRVVRLLCSLLPDNPPEEPKPLWWRDFCFAIADGWAVMLQRLYYPQTSRSCPDPFVFPLGFYQMIDSGSLQNASFILHRLTEKLSRTLLRLQENIIGLASINCYLFLSVLSLKMLDFFHYLCPSLAPLFKYIQIRSSYSLAFMLHRETDLSPSLAKQLNKIKSHRNNFLKMFSSLTQLLGNVWKSFPSIISNFRDEVFQNGYFCKMTGMDWSGTDSVLT